MNTCYIVGAGDCPELHFSPAETDFVIAADAGYVRLTAAGIKPDLVVGDFDSLGCVPDGEQIIRHPIRKDDTDTMLAVKLGLERGFRMFQLYGGMGGRLDHTLANIQTLHYLCKHGALGLLTQPDQTFCVIADRCVTFSAEAHGLFSVFALSEHVSGVTLHNLLYPLHDAALTSDFPLGVSNAFTDAPASVSVAHGTLLLMWYGSADWLRLD